MNNMEILMQLPATCTNLVLVYIFRHGTLLINLMKRKDYRAEGWQNLYHEYINDSTSVFLKTFREAKTDMEDF